MGAPPREPRGILVGLLADGRVGLAVVLLVPPVRGWNAAFRLLLVAGIALQGTMPVIMWRRGRSDHYDDDPTWTRDLGTDDWLVVVHDPHDVSRAHHIIERRRPLCLYDAVPLAPVA